MLSHKRIAFLCLAVFLGLNRYEIEAPEADVVTVFVGLAAGRMSETPLGSGSAHTWCLFGSLDQAPAAS